MSGGIAYVLDENHDLYLRLQQAAGASMERDRASTTAMSLREHDPTRTCAATGSAEGPATILDDFAGYAAQL